MADTKLSALTEVTSLVGTDELYINDAAVSKRITFTNLSAEVATVNNLSGTNTGDETTATTSAEGIVERSDSGENVAGTDDTVYPTVAGVKEMIEEHQSGAGLVQGKMKFQTSTADSPTNDKLRFDTGAYGTVTEIKISDTVEGGGDATNFLTALSVGDQIYIQARKDAGKFCTWTVNSAVTDEGSWFTIPVDEANNGVFFSNDEKISVSLLYSSGLINTSATTTAEGIVERSTSAENQTGTSDTVYPTVLGVKEIAGSILQNSRSAAYTTVMTDMGKHIFHPSADTTARIWTIDSNANVAYPIGATIVFINEVSGGVITISITSDTLILSPDGTSGSRSLAADGIATAVKVTSTKWMISGTGLT